MDGKNDLGYLKLYGLDEQFFWRVESEAFWSLVWLNIIAVDYFYLHYHGSAVSRQSRNLAKVWKGMLSVAGASFIVGDVDVNSSRYRYYAQRPYIANLFDLPAG